MTRPTHLDKAEIVAVLRSRGLDARADWVDRNLPDLVDVYRNAALLQMLDIDPAAIAAEPEPQPGNNNARSSRGRDRDATGRPRNARPRDELGRPLPRDAASAAELPADVVLPPQESLAEAQRLLDAGRSFQAHEVLEGTWKAAPEAERELWRGLAQLAVGLTHVRRGNAIGAVQLLRRAAERIDGYAHEPPYGVAVAGLVVWTGALIARIERQGLASLAPDDLTVHLRG